jgi:hypothetical protein
MVFKLDHVLISAINVLGMLFTDFYNDRPPVHRRGPTMGMSNSQRMMLKSTGRSQSQQSQGSQDSDDVVAPPYSVVKKPNRPGTSMLSWHVGETMHVPLQGQSSAGLANYYEQLLGAPSCPRGPG